MDNLMRILMLGVVMFALSSVPAPVDRTLERDGVSAERFELNSAPATFGDPQGLSGAIAGLVLTAPVAAQNGGNGGGECNDWCMQRTDGKGSHCEQDQHHPPQTALSGPHAECANIDVDCPESGFGDGECTECVVTYIDPSCQPPGNGGNGGNGGSGGQFASFGIAPSGIIVADPEMRLLRTSDGLLRTQCGGFVAGASRAWIRPARLLI
jgi:hypothetical protein